MKEFITSILSNIVSSFFQPIADIFNGVVSSIFTSTTIPYFILVGLMLIFFIVFYFVFSFGIGRWQWNHIYSSYVQCLTLNADGTAVDTEKLSTIGKEEFKGVITGTYIGNDISIDKLEVKAQNAQLSAEIKFADGKKEEHSNENSLSIYNEPIEIKYSIIFPNNHPENINIDVSMRYSQDIMEPKYFVEVKRPMKKLVVELRVHNNIRIRNIRKQINTKLGDSEILFNKKIKGKQCKDDPTMTSYMFVVYNPRIMRQYEINWNWV